MGLKESLFIFTLVPNARGMNCCLADLTLSLCSLLSFCLCVFITWVQHNNLLAMKTTRWHLKRYNIHMTLSIRRKALDHISCIVWAGLCDCFCRGKNIVDSVCNKCSVCVSIGISRHACGAPFKNTTLVWQKPLKDQVRPKWSQEGGNINIVWVSSN